MRMIDLIEKKKSGKELSSGEIGAWIEGVVDRSVPDYQSAALLMAIRFRGLTDEETFFLTEKMLHSGEILDLSSIKEPTSDKHSTGGVGDKLSFIVGPLAAACGVAVPMLSGRALGHTGGTLDKLESIPGYETRLPTERFLRIVSDVGISIIGQTERLAPADGRIYSLRDVTGTVDSVPLIVASILSKKVAAGPASLVFDVKCGDGAIFDDSEMSRRLARLLVRIASRMGKSASALITEMSTPLGRTVGNALEIAESIEALQGGGEEDMMKISLALAGEMLLRAGRADSEKEAGALLDDALTSGRALETFQRMIVAHGGDGSVVDDPDRLPAARFRRDVTAPAPGFVQSLSARTTGLAAMRLGAGREKVDDRVSAGAGVVIVRRPGETVAAGETLAVLHADDEEKISQAVPEVQGAFRIGPDRPEKKPLVLETIRSGEAGGEGNR